MPKLSDYLKMTDAQLAEEGVTREELEFMVQEHQSAVTELDAMNNICRAINRFSNKFDILLEIAEDYVETQKADMPDMDFIEDKMSRLEELQLSKEQTEESQIEMGKCVADILQELRNALGRNDDEPENE